MAQRITIFWRDIPAQVIVRQGRTAEKRELSERFAKAIDVAAMKSGARSADAYTEEYRRVSEECGSDLKAELETAIAALEAEYDDEKLKALVANGGRAE